MRILSYAFTLAVLCAGMWGIMRGAVAILTAAGGLQ